MRATRTKGSTVGSVQCVNAHRVGYAVCNCGYEDGGRSRWGPPGPRAAQWDLSSV